MAEEEIRQLRLLLLRVSEELTNAVEKLHKRAFKGNP